MAGWFVPVERGWVGGQLHGGQVVLVCHQDVGGGVHQPHPGYQHLGERKRNLVAVASRSLPFFGGVGGVARVSASCARHWTQQTFYDKILWKETYWLEFGGNRNSITVRSVSVTESESVSVKPKLFCFYTYFTIPTVESVEDGCLNKTCVIFTTFL